MSHRFHELNFRIPYLVHLSWLRPHSNILFSLLPLCLCQPIFKIFFFMYFIGDPELYWGILYYLLMVRNDYGITCILATLVTWREWHMPHALARVTYATCTGESGVCYKHWREWCMHMHWREWHVPRALARLVYATSTGESGICHMHWREWHVPQVLVTGMSVVSRAPRVVCPTLTRHFLSRVGTGPLPTPLCRRRTHTPQMSPALMCKVATNILMNRGY